MIEYQREISRSSAELIKAEIGYLYKQAEVVAKNPNTKDAVEVLKEINKIDAQDPK